MFKVHRVSQGNWNWETPRENEHWHWEDAQTQNWRLCVETMKGAKYIKGLCSSEKFPQNIMKFSSGSRVTPCFHMSVVFKQLYLGILQKGVLLIPTERSLMLFINLPTTCFHLWPHFSYSPKVSQVYTSQISSPGLPGQRPTCPVPGARVRPFPPPLDDMNGQKISHFLNRSKNESNMLLVDGWTQPIFKKNLCQNWDHLQILRLFEQTNIFQTHHLGGFQTLKATWSPFSRTFGPRFQEGTNAGAWEGKGPVGGPSGLRPPERKMTAVKLKVAEIHYILYIYKLWMRMNFLKNDTCTFSSENEKYLNVMFTEAWKENTEETRNTIIGGDNSPLKKNMVIELCIIWIFIFSNGKIPQVKTHTHIHTKKKRRRPRRPSDGKRNRRRLIPNSTLDPKRALCLGRKVAFERSEGLKGGSFGRKALELPAFFQQVVRWVKDGCWLGCSCSDREPKV